MAKFSLIPFTQENAPDITIEAELNYNEESVYVSYRIKKGTPLIDLGCSTPNKSRVLKLWEKTCFELFIKNKNDQYIEFNFSPNFEWNCFYFDKKGDVLKEWDDMAMPVTDILLSSEHFLLFVDIKKAFFPKEFFNADSELNAGITSVIKDKSGAMSYWALAHADTRPNFHHFDSFKYKF
ncbi:MAG: hypothetical protein PHY93_04240 [Bacteriovorax sp.]|nr:hypothetical protein [Bacteriovorax sp.]